MCPLAPHNLTDPKDVDLNKQIIFSLENNSKTLRKKNPNRHEKKLM